METEKNEFFQFMEANLRSKMTTVNTLRHLKAHNSLEQCTRKNSVRLFGVKENDDENPEKLAIQVFYKQLHLENKS